MREPAQPSSALDPTAAIALALGMAKPLLLGLGTTTPGRLRGDRRACVAIGSRSPSPFGISTLA